MTATASQTHIHRWQIPTGAAIAIGTCDCGATRRFGNSLEAVAALKGRRFGGFANVNGTICADCGGPLKSWRSQRCAPCNGRMMLARRRSQ